MILPQSMFKGLNQTHFLNFKPISENVLSQADGIKE